MGVRRVLVTGADGFIGSHVTESLVRAGYEVRAMVLYNSFGSWGWLDQCDQDVRGKFEVIAGDIRDTYSVALAMKGCDAVLHLAALIAIPYSYVAPASYIDTNVKGTLNILQAARDLEVSKIVHTSTSEVYGSAQFVPITEEHPLSAQSPYAASKIAADHLALSYYRSFGTPVAVLRPFNTYGPRQSARAIIPTIITQTARGATSIKLGSLQPTRDFLFVEDTVKGFIAALESAGTIGQVINIGSGHEIAVGEMANLITREMGREIPIESESKRIRPEDSEVTRLLASSDKARAAMQWRPEYHGADGLKRGLRATIAWFTAPGNLERYKPDIYNV